MYDNGKSFTTEILASSIRTPLHVKQAAIAGADVATVPPAILRNLARHPLTSTRASSRFLPTGERLGRRSCSCAQWNRGGKAIMKTALNYRLNSFA
ncbi:hypothetical protein FJ945_12605 [Mesorhizobium sp. B2-4-9]|nr:hypothetical protein FJ550_20125 [Mesorhizobium sp. B2-5-2]TPL23919.1 hypothetical protein FJ946_15945 [Mesorhizobium sp. B2-4-7]TPL26212.1 hypothetical protein FJ945_12605 [Mesorhizobium sp. B2-4-9]TPL32830.1 hypothetical protein FJ961_30475 [Mesorhizobium sp. B2-4-5]TPM68976.1 hypothetical protein FJ968_29130 [Mesorhizobium sp. B2-1-6]TPN72411.1 hypothetical protein FJ985_29740 [Mesorhizobium sp. B1-1-2]